MYHRLASCPHSLTILKKLCCVFAQKAYQESAMAGVEDHDETPHVAVAPLDWQPTIMHV